MHPASFGPPPDPEPPDPPLPADASAPPVPTVPLAPPAPLVLAVVAAPLLVATLEVSPVLVPDPDVVLEVPVALALELDDDPLVVPDAPDVVPDGEPLGPFEPSLDVHAPMLTRAQSAPAIIAVR